MPELLSLNDTTYEAELLGGDKVEIGDKSSSDFKPSIKLNRWGSECFIKVGLPITPAQEQIKPTIEAGKVKWVDKDIEVHFYPLEPRTVIAKDKDGRDRQFRQNELGGFEFEVILKKKPKTNKIVLNIEIQGLKFSYQPALTQEEIDEGCVCPDNVIGSYVFYHATRTNVHASKEDAEKYRACKAGTFYRPKITDAGGKWVWGELSIDEKAGTLITTIPQDFLDNAVYPISTGTTNFGYEVMGGANSSLENWLKGIVAGSGGAGTGNSISIGVYEGWASGYKLKAALYDASSNLVTNGATEERDSGGANLTFHTFDFPSSPSITDQTYYIVGWSDSIVQIGYDASAPGSTRCYQSLTYGDWPAKASFTTSADKAYSIYCTYEAVAAGWTHKYLGVANASIGKINGVAKASIKKVNGVE